MTTTEVFTRCTRPVKDAYGNDAVRLDSLERLPGGGQDVQHWATVPADEAHSHIVTAFMESGALPMPHENGVIPLLTLDHFREAGFVAKPRHQNAENGAPVITGAVA